MKQGIEVKLAADAEALTKDLQRAADKVEAWKGKVTGLFAAAGTLGGNAIISGMQSAIALGSAGIQAAIDQIMTAIDVGGGLADLAATTKEGAGGIYILQRAMSLGGADAEMLGKKVMTLNKVIAEGLRGSSSANNLFDRLGISAKELEKMGLVERISAIQTAFGGMSSSIEKSSLSAQLFSDRGGEFLKFLETGSIEDAAKDFASNAEAWDKSASKLEALGDKMEVFTEQMAGFGLGLATVVEGPLTQFLDKMNGANWVAAGESLANSVAAIPGVSKSIAPMLGPAGAPVSAIGAIADIKPALAMGEVGGNMAKSIAGGLNSLLFGDIEAARSKAMIDDAAKARLERRQARTEVYAPEFVAPTMPMLAPPTLGMGKIPLTSLIKTQAPQLAAPDLRELMPAAPGMPETPKQGGNFFANVGLGPRKSTAWDRLQAGESQFNSLQSGGTAWQRLQRGESSSSMSEAGGLVRRGDAARRAYAEKMKESDPGKGTEGTNSRLDSLVQLAKKLVE